MKKGRTDVPSVDCAILRQSVSQNNFERAECRSACEDVVLIVNLFSEPAADETASDRPVGCSTIDPKSINEVVEV